MQEQQLAAENQLFAHAVEQETISRRAAAAHDPADPDPERVALAEEFNAAGIEAFGEGRFGVAAEKLSGAIRMDPSNPAFYGNRSLALERGERFEQALDDAESCLRCDPTYAKGYERKGRALLGLGEYAAAEAAFQRGLILQPGDAGLEDGLLEAGHAATRHKLEIVRRGNEVLGLDPADLMGAGGRDGDGKRGGGRSELR